VTPTIQGTTLRAIAYAPGMSDSDLNDGTYYYLGGNGADIDPAAAAPPGDVGSPPAEGGSQSASVVPNYDHNGNLISYKDWSYSYDAQNRLTSASKGAHTALFHYDGKNRQIMRSIDGTVRFSVWDDWELLEEYDTSNVKQAAYLQGPHGVIKSLVNNVYYYQDKLGSTSHVADSSGNLLESYRYDLFGTPSYFNSTSQPINSSTVGVTDLYAGERWIGDLSLYDLRNRFMAPELGRFLQTDPIGFQGDASNLYRYCHNDPEDFSDPTGLIADWTWSHLMWEQGNSPYGFNDLYQKYVDAGASGGGGGGGGGLTMATVKAEVEGKKSNSIDPKLKQFDVPGTIDRLDAKAQLYAERFPKYPNGSAVVKALRSAEKEGRIRAGNPADFKKANPMYTQGNAIYINPQAKILSGDTPSLLAHEGQHLIDGGRGIPFDRERRAYNAQYGFGRLTGSVRALVTDDEIRDFLKSH
jgi:RHS repeat-associated protein